MWLHSTFSPASLFSLSEASLQIQLLVRIDKDLQSLFTAATASAAVEATAAAAPDTLFGDAVEGGINKTDVIRQIIREGGSNGASPTEIWQGVQKRNVPMHRNYVYAVLARLAEKNEAREVNGRYILAQVQ